MSVVLIKVNNANSVVETYKDVINDGNTTRIPAQNAVNYEFVDESTGLAPEHILVKRDENDLLTDVTHPTTIAAADRQPY